MTLCRPVVHQRSIFKVEEQTREADSNASYLLGLLFDLEDGGNAFLRRVGELLPDYVTSYPTR
jgi:hypothetical protein